MSSIAEALNRDCACISVDRDALRTLLDRGSEPAGLYASILAKQPHLFASVPVFMDRTHAEAMFSIVRAVERAVAVPAFQDAALDLAPPIARAAFGPLGVFYGYDFHLGSDGPRLIEINTNAGGALLNAVLAQAQKACCPEIEALVTGPVSLDDDELRGAAKAAMAANPETRTVIQAAGDASHASVLHAMDELRESGVTRIAFAADKAPRTSPSPAR